MERRPFGKTGEELPVLGFGCGGIGQDEACSEAEAVALLNAALDGGIRYFDTSWFYSDGESERRVGRVAAERRDEMWIATKLRDTTRDGALRQLDESLARLQTDQVDEWRLHNVWDFERLDAFTAPGGAVEALTEAREQGLVRYASFSCHNDPRIALEAMRRFPFDSALVALSGLGHFILSFVEEFLPAARQRGIAIVAMKVLGGGALAGEVERALRYSLGLPISVALVGMERMEHLEANLAVAESFTPLNDEEKLAFFQDIAHLVRPRNVYWKTTDMGNPVRWLDRGAGRGATAVSVDAG